jgi:antitoxin VapB
VAYSIKDPVTDEIIRRLAKAKGMPIVDAIREACLNELERERAKTPLWERLKPLAERVASYPPRDAEPQQTDKEFFDAMWAERS